MDYGEKNTIGNPRKSEKPNLGATGTKAVSGPTALSSGSGLGLLFFLKSFSALLSHPAGFLCLPVLHTPHSGCSNRIYMPLLQASAPINCYYFFVFPTENLLRGNHIGLSFWSAYELAGCFWVASPFGLVSYGWTWGMEYKIL